MIISVGSFLLFSSCLYSRGGDGSFKSIFMLSHLVFVLEERLVYLSLGEDTVTSQAAAAHCSGPYLEAVIQKYNGSQSSKTWCPKEIIYIQCDGIYVFP